MDCVVEGILSFCEFLRLSEEKGMEEVGQEVVVVVVTAKRSSCYINPHKNPTAKTPGTEQS